MSDIVEVLKKAIYDELCLQDRSGCYTAEKGTLYVGSGYLSEEGVANAVLAALSEAGWVVVERAALDRMGAKLDKVLENAMIAALPPSLIAPKSHGIAHEQEPYEGENEGKE